MQLSLPQRVSSVGPKQEAASPDVRFTSDSDQTSASQRSDALCHKQTYAPQQRPWLFDHPVKRLLLKALPNDSLLKLNLTRQVVAPPNRQHPGKVFSAIVG